MKGTLLTMLQLSKAVNETVDLTAHDCQQDSELKQGKEGLAFYCTTCGKRTGPVRNKLS